MLAQASLIFLLSSALFSAAHGAPEVHVPEQKVTYRGSLSGSIEHFQGIKYGKDTAGERRFAPPEPFIPEEDTIIDAIQAGQICPQSEAAIPLAVDATPAISEDCLNLRIARPANTAPDSKLPVVVWLHGGGVIKGSAYDSHFDPDKLVEIPIKDGTPLIYAALNYRLTIFGFSRLETLKEQKSLNAGARDQRLALQWIQDHIQAFGGDPERITIYGLSAGGTFSGLQTMAYGGEHGVPFQQAWMMSGPPGTAMNMSSDASRTHTLSVAENLDCKGSDEEVLKCLRAVPMKELLDVAMTYSRENHPPAGLFTFIPSVDDDFFPDRQSVLAREGRFAKGIKAILGWTQDDGSMNAGNALAIQAEDDMIAPIKNFARTLSPSQLTDLFTLYPTTSFTRDLANYEARKSPTDPTISIHFFRLARILRDILFTCPSISFGYEMYHHTRQTRPDFDSVRLYDLNQTVYTAMLAGAGMPYAGVIHGSDTAYIFNGYPEGKLSGDDQTLATKFVRALVNFAYHGTPVSPSSPNDEHLPAWPPSYSPQEVIGSIPAEFNIQVIGGPHGTRPAAVKNSPGIAEYKMDPQGILNDILVYAGMRSASDETPEELIGSEMLYERCKYIDSLDETLGR